MVCSRILCFIHFVSFYLYPLEAEDKNIFIDTRNGNSLIDWSLLKATLKFYIIFKRCDLVAVP